jgi:hypothetical protein
MGTCDKEIHISDDNKIFRRILVMEREKGFNKML